MNFDIPIIKTETVDLKLLVVDIPTREDDEVPGGFPFLAGERWVFGVDLDSQRINGWPEGVAGEITIKVRDGGNYSVYDIDGKCWLQILEDYVPSLIPEGGDYVVLDIGPDGTINNWPSVPSIVDFLTEEERHWL